MAGLRFHDDVVNDAVNGVVGNVDKGSTDPAGAAELYSGAPPANLADAPAGTLLAVVDYDEPAFTPGGDGALDPGVSQARELPRSTTGVDDGEIGFVRVVDRDGVPRWDDDGVGTSAGPGVRFVFNTLNVSVGVDFSLTDHTMSVISETAV